MNPVNMVKTVLYCRKSASFNINCFKLLNQKILAKDLNIVTVHISIDFLLEREFCLKGAVLLDG